MNRMLTLVFKLLVLGVIACLMSGNLSAQSGGAYHTVQPGENLYRISLRYGTTIQVLMQANGISDPHRVYVGQQLWIPMGRGSLPVPSPTSLPIPSPVPSPPPLPAPSPVLLPTLLPVPAPVERDPSVQTGANVHVVQPGENLYRISLRYGVTARALAWANGLSNVNLVYVGQRLVIPVSGSVPSGFVPVNPAPPPPSTEGKHIVVVLAEQRMHAYEHGQLVRSSLVSTGLPGTPTVTGDYHIYVKYHSQLMSGPGYYLPNVPYVMYFYKGYSLHGTYWHSNFGRPMSHGCVNLPTSEAAWLYEWAPIGTLVTVRR